jgi:hypothetical protein
MILSTIPTGRSERHWSLNKPAQLCGLDSLRVGHRNQVCKTGWAGPDLVTERTSLARFITDQHENWQPIMQDLTFFIAQFSGFNIIMFDFSCKISNIIKYNKKRCLGLPDQSFHKLSLPKKNSKSACHHKVVMSRKHSRTHLFIQLIRGNITFK